MFRSLIFLLACGAFTGKSIAMGMRDLPPGPQKTNNASTSVLVENANSTTCDVGEHEKVKDSLLCNDAEDGLQECKNYCQKKYGPELVAVECTAPRKDIGKDSGKRECICKLSKFCQIML